MNAITQLSPNRLPITVEGERHSFNTNMRKSGVPESVIMKITGHSTREMFLRYDTVDGSDTRKAVDQMEGFLKSVDQTVDQTPLKLKEG